MTRNLIPAVFALAIASVPSTGFALPEEEHKAMLDEVRVIDIQLREVKNKSKKARTIDEILVDIRVLMKRYPGEKAPWHMLLGASTLVEEKDRRVRILEEIVKLEGKEFSYARKEAEDRLWKERALGKPIELEFVAHDGRFVDIAKMKGKVVLVYFCAGWCPPCVHEGKGVKKLYDRVHDKGFEVIGISFDKTREDLEAYTERQGYKWPQMFQEENWKSKFVTESRIRAIPTLWLIDRKGNLVDMEAREDLDKKVEKLLAEKVQTK